MILQKTYDLLIKMTLVGVINLFGITTMNAFIYSHFDKGIQRAKEYDVNYKSNVSSNNAATKIAKSQKEKLKYRHFSINKQLNSYFTKLN